MEATDLVKQATNPLIGEVTQFDLEIENATESGTGSDVVNVAEGGLSFGPVDIAEEDETVEFSVPEEGSLQVDLTAGETGPIEITAGTIVTSVSAMGIIDVVVTCTAFDGQDTLLSTIDVEDEEPEEPEVPEEPVLEVVGDNPMELEIGDEYVEEGVTVDGEANEDVVITGEVDTDVAGEYTDTYTLTYGEDDETVTTTRTVNVVEEDEEEPEEPVLEVVGDNPMELEVGDSYVEEGVTVDGEANENVDRKGVV